MAGKFIVIDGIDGSGKETQTKLTISRLKKLGYNVETIDFPQYNTKSAGLVEKYLSGKYGGTKEVSPYVASTFYAVDRYDASFKIKEWLKQGKIIISDRYVGSNMAHQGAKIKTQNERKKYLTWLYNLEYEIFKIPRPDLNIILHINATLAQKLSQRRKKQDWHNKTEDIHQNNLGYLKSSEKIYLEIVNTFSDFTLIECEKNGQTMSREKINNLICGKIIKMI
ncbi:MAG: dTMP kinase [Patescibacteria group bacterium]|nr:dTMP kinase [Patescibacteria group bacterium]